MRVSTSVTACTPSRAATGPGAGRDRLAAGHARSRPGGRWPPGSSIGRTAGRCGPGRGGAGPGEHQGVLALEEPVAAHAAGGAALGGVLRERRHLDRAGLGAGQRRGRAGRRDHDRALGASGRSRRTTTTRSPEATPDAGDAAAGAALRPHRVGAEVQQLGVGGDEAQLSAPVVSSTAPTTSSPSSSQITSHSSLPRTSGLTRLTTPWRVPSARPGPSAASVHSASSRSPGSRARISLTGRPPGEVRVVGGVGQRGQVQDADLDQPARRLVRPPTSPRAVARTAGDDHVVVGAAAALAGRLGVRGAGQQPGGGEVGEAGVVGDLERRGGRRHRGAGRLQQHGAARGAEGLGDLGELVGDDLPQQLLVAEDRVELLDDRARARTSPSPARSGRTWSAGAAACPGCSRPGSR